MLYNVLCNQFYKYIQTENTKTNLVVLKWYFIHKDNM